MALLSTSTKDEFEEKVIKGKRPVLVDFWATWCPPCRMMAPILEKLAKDYDGKVDIVKVDVDQSEDNRALAQEYGVQGIPNMQIFKNGKVMQEMVGAYPEALVAQEFDKVLK